MDFGAASCGPTNLFFYRRLGPPIDVTSLGPIWLLEVERRAQIVRWEDRREVIGEVSGPQMERRPARWRV